MFRNGSEPPPPDRLIDDLLFRRREREKARITRLHRETCTLCTHVLYRLVRRLFSSNTFGTRWMDFFTIFFFHFFGLSGREWSRIVVVLMDASYALPTCFDDNRVRKWSSGVRRHAPRVGRSARYAEGTRLMGTSGGSQATVAVFVEPSVSNFARSACQQTHASGTAD